MREVRVEVPALDAKAAGVLGLVGAHCLPGGENHGVNALLGGSRAVDRSGDPAYVVDVHAAVERVGNLDDGALAHAVGDDVGAGVQKDRTLERIRPVVVVGEAAQRRLDAAKHDGHVLVRAADEVAVDHVRVVGAQSHLAAGGVEVLGATVLRHGVVVDHRVHVAAAHEKRQARLAQDGDACGVAPVGLRDDAHLVAVRLQHARDDGAGKRGVVNVGVAAHKDKVALVPAARLHVLARDGEKGRAVWAMVRRDVLAAVGAMAAVRAGAVAAVVAVCSVAAVAPRSIVPALLRFARLLVHASPFLRLFATSVVERPAHTSVCAGRTAFHRYVMKLTAECQKRVTCQRERHIWLHQV